MGKKSVRKNLLISIILGVLTGCILAQVYFSLFGSAIISHLQAWPIQILVYVIMFPSIIGSIFCDLIDVDSYNCIPYFWFVFPITYALVFAVVYFLYSRLKK